ncbi:MAG: hypothetical protein E4G74_00820 [Erysipelotrichales bacterium]|nr:MAG: hypothetical protein E4G74_00820 [Erysipelotrichales bacterium]
MTFYVAKGICRHEPLYAKACFDILLEMTTRILEWEVILQEGPQVNLGKFRRHLKDYLPAQTYAAFEDCFPNLQLDSLTQKLTIIMDFFEQHARYVAERSGYDPDVEPAERIKAHVFMLIAASK